MTELKEALNSLSIYSTKKVSIVTAGGGSYFSNLLLVPGCGSVIGSINNLYSDDSIEKFLGAPLEGSAVTKKRLNELHAKNQENNPDCLCITLTVALPTSRIRKGPNHCFMVFDDRFFHLELLKEHDSTNMYPDLIETFRAKTEQAIFNGLFYAVFLSDFWKRQKDKYESYIVKFDKLGPNEV